MFLLYTILITILVVLYLCFTRFEGFETDATVLEEKRLGVYNQPSVIYENGSAVKNMKKLNDMRCWIILKFLSQSAKLTQYKFDKIIETMNKYESTYDCNTSYVSLKTRLKMLEKQGGEKKYKLEMDRLKRSISYHKNACDFRRLFDEHNSFMSEFGYEGELFTDLNLLQCENGHAGNVLPE